MQHHFYDQMCEICAPFNFAKRTQTVDLTGRVALVTGARVKIGFQVRTVVTILGSPDSIHNRASETRRLS